MVAMEKGSRNGGTFNQRNFRRGREGAERRRQWSLKFLWRPLGKLLSKTSWGGGQDCIL